MGNKRGPEYLPALVEAVANGASISRAAEMVGRSTTTCWEAIQRHAPDLPRNLKPRVTAAERIDYISRYQSGASVHEIAIGANRDWQTVDRAIFSDDQIHVGEHRCPSCGGLIVTPLCLRCSIQ